MRTSFGHLNFSSGLDNWMFAVFACNQYVDEQAPWALKKTDPERMAAVLMTLFRCVRDLAIAVRPVVPTCDRPFARPDGHCSRCARFCALEDGEWFASLAGSGFRLAQPEGVFPRLELPEVAAEDG